MIAGEYLEVLKLGRCSATILMVDTYAEPFGGPPIRASGPSTATRAARRFEAWFGHNCATETARARPRVSV